MEEKIKEDTFKIGDVIHTLRTRNKLKQEELAIMTGLPRSVISAHETGRRTPTKYHIQNTMKPLDMILRNLLLWKRRCQ